MTLSTAGDSAFEVDAYLQAGIRRERPRFIGDNVTNRHLVGSPGTSASAITVGSYDFSDEFEYAAKSLKSPGL